MFRRSKLQLIKRLAPYAASTPLQARLDRLWGFKPEALKPKKQKRSTRAARKVKHGDVKAKVEEAFSSLTRGDDCEKETPKAADNPQEDNEKPERRNPWEPDPDVQFQKRVFKETVNEIRNLVYPHLDPIAKRQYDNAKLTALGGKVAKNRKMPYNEFVQRTRALKRNVEKNKELEKQLGVKLFIDTKGGARFANIEKRKRIKEFKDSKSPFDFGGKNGVYHIKHKKFT